LSFWLPYYVSIFMSKSSCRKIRYKYVEKFVTHFSLQKYSIFFICASFCMKFYSKYAIFGCFE